MEVRELTTSEGVFCVRTFGPTDDTTTPSEASAAPLSELPVIFYLHGAAMSSMSWVPCVSLITQNGAARGCAIDLRGHGLTPAPINPPALSAEQLTADVVACIDAAMLTLYPTQEHFYLVGHSLGGALTCRVSAAWKERNNRQPESEEQEKKKGNRDITLAGMVVIDVVEGTAKMSLKFMKEWVAKRPVWFACEDDAVKWFNQHGGIHNLRSCKVTIPPLLKPGKNDKGEHGLVWITDLASTSEHWEGWFDNLNHYFLAAPCSKILCLAGTDRLDTPLTVAQMQGKFQLVVMGGGVGHYIQEDDPAGLAGKLVTFVKRVDGLTRKLQMANKKWN